MAPNPAERQDESQSADRILAEALRSTVEDAVGASVRADRRVLAGALAPVLGPAIRLAVQNALRDALEALGAIINRNFTWTGLRWRWKAMRTGKSVSEIALLESVRYRVEHALLFHRDTGLLMLQRSHPSAPNQNLDVVSPMLTAIQDFVRDSFDIREENGLHSIRFSDVTISVEHGAFASLAVVVRGTPPPDFRAMLSELLEDLQRKGGREMMTFTGDTAPFERLGDLLANCLEARYEEAPAKQTHAAAWISLGVCGLALATFIGIRLVGRVRWQSYIEALERQPGISVSTAERGWTRSRLAGLRDPLAADPAPLARRYGVDPARIDFAWKEFVSLEPSLIEARARDVLHPPAGVQIEVRDRTLAARGSAPHAWIRDTRRLAPALVGVNRVDWSGVVDIEISTEAQAIEAENVRFPVGVSALSPDAIEIVKRVAANFEKLDELARENGVRAEITILGHSDHTGAEKANVQLARERAAATGKALETLGAPSERITADSGVEDEMRGATFRVVLAASPGGR